jgi:hypothetical protein
MLIAEMPKAIFSSNIDVHCQKVLNQQSRLLSGSRPVLVDNTAGKTHKTIPDTHATGSRKDKTEIASFNVQAMRSWI